MTVICHICNKPYSNSSGLNRHIKEFHKEGHLRFPCLEKGCGKDFATEQSLSNHKRDQHSGINLKCQKCGKEGYNKNSLDYHMKSCNNPDKKFTCHFIGCDKSRASNKNMINHMDTCEFKKNGIKEDHNQEEKKRKIEEVYENEKNEMKIFMEKMSTNFKDMTKKQCGGCGSTRLSWGLSGKDKTHCTKHKGELENLTGKCKFKKCIIKGTLRIGEFKFCATHRDFLIKEGLPDGKESVKKTKDTHRHCKEDGCNTIASFSGYCYHHSTDGISDDKRSCEINDENCKKRDGTNAQNSRPIYGLSGETPTRCYAHKEDGMVSRKICEGKDDDGKECETSANYGPKCGGPIYCKKHRSESDVNLTSSRCCMECCTGDYIQAHFRHPENTNKDSKFYNKRICRFKATVFLHDAIMNGDTKTFDRLKDFFDMKKNNTLNALSAFRIECEKNYYESLKTCVSILFDQSPRDGPKSVEDKRPDIFYKWEVNGLFYGIHIEYDEESTHEKEESRMEWIAKESGCEGRVYVIRVDGGHDTKNPVSSRVLSGCKRYEYYEITPTGKNVALEVAKSVVERINWIQNGIEPIEDNVSIRI